MGSQGLPVQTHGLTQMPLSLLLLEEARWPRKDQALEEGARSGFEYQLIYY